MEVGGEGVNRRISVIGLGRVGLPLALAFADRGCSVVGVDIDEGRLASLRQGRLPFLEQGGEEVLRRCLGTHFTVTRNADEAVRVTDTVVLTLGTPVDEHMNPIFSQLEQVMDALCPRLRDGHTVILRSTIAPGTTEYFRRYLERRTGLAVGRDIFLAYCPERIAEGRSLEEIPKLPQIIGVLEAESARRVEAVFRLLTPLTLVSDAMSAELAKLFCNMYRYIDFAIANEFMFVAEQYGRNIYEILDLVNRDYPRGGLKQPGFTAGPCLYKDGFFLLDSVPYVELISAAWRINETVPGYLIEQIRRHKEISGSTVLILGLSFKKNIDDPRNSLSYKAKKVFQRRGATVLLHDPYLAPGDLPALLARADVVLVAMNHDAYADLGLDFLRQHAKRGCVVCDIWNIFGVGRIIFSLSPDTLAPESDRGGAGQWPSPS